MKAGDKVRLKSLRPEYSRLEDAVYTVLEVGNKTISVKHPDIGGHFVFASDLILEVINDDGI